MRIRVDDYPSGSPVCTIPDGYREMLAGFVRALQGPFCLGVVWGFLPPEEGDFLAGFPDIHVASHGITHSRRDVNRDECVLLMRQLCERWSPHILIPPENMIANYPLVATHFDIILSGPPETGPKGPKMLMPWFYGTARDMVQAGTLPGEKDIVALHLKWEATTNFKYVEELGSGKFGPILYWSE